MDGTTVIKIEENHYEDGCSVDPLVSRPTVTFSVPTMSHPTDECEPLEIVKTADNLVVKSKRKQSLVRRNFEESESSTQDTTLQIQTPSSLNQERGAETYQWELCISDGNKLKFYANETSSPNHVETNHGSTPQVKCEICFKEFKVFSSLKRHSRVHSNQPFKCEVCIKYFNSSSALEAHSCGRLELASSALKCEICSTTFSKRAARNQHLVRVHKHSSEKLNVKEFPCDICSKIYYTKSDLEQHVVVAHVVDKPYECHVCSKTFIDQDALSKHVMMRHDKQPCYVCDVCAKAFKLKKVLLSHLRIEHHKFFRCNKCKKSFSNKSEFDAHSDLQQEIQNACQICNKTFPNQCSLSLHVECNNSTELQNQDSDFKFEKIKIEYDEFKCELCFKTFDREAYLAAHRRLVHPNSRWPCSKCSAAFRSYTVMKQHELTHEIKKRQRKICDRSFRRQKDLRIHEMKPHFKCQLCSKTFKMHWNMKQHAKLKRFQCRICGKSYCGRTRFKVHQQKSHSITKHVRCQLCPKSFTTSGALIWHNRIFHGVEGQDTTEGVNENNRKEFKCPLCSKTFDRRDYFAAHRRLVDPNSLWPCSKCPGAFRLFSKMKEHELAHQVKAHKCKFCAKSFGRGFELRVHEMRIHFKCHLCPESFAGATLLKLHIANDHSGREKPFKCIVCNTFWITATYLKTHTLLSHRTGMSFPCESCSKSFINPYSLNRHKLKVHVLNDAKEQEIFRRPLESFGFLCHLCSFKAQDDREVAAHYYDHGLPKVMLQRISAFIKFEVDENAGLNFLPGTSAEISSEAPRMLLIPEDKTWFSNTSIINGATDMSSGSKLLHQTDCGPLKIEPTIDRVVQSKRKQSHERTLLRNCKRSKSGTQEDALQIQSSLVHGLDAQTYRSQKKLKCYSNKNRIRSHVDRIHCSTPRFK